MSPWKVLKSEILLHAGFFRLRIDECQLPDGRIMPRYHVLEFPDWVNIVPVTSDGQMILVRQYRQAAGVECLEIPGGGLNGYTEDPQVGGARELREETGFKAGSWVSCGFQYPNPALQNNRMHVYLALDCVKVAEPSLDPFEDLTVEFLPVRDVYARLRDGQFPHALIAASLGAALKPLQERGFL